MTNQFYILLFATKIMNNSSMNFEFAYFYAIIMTYLLIFVFMFSSNPNLNCVITTQCVDILFRLCILELELQERRLTVQLYPKYGTNKHMRINRQVIFVPFTHHRHTFHLQFICNYKQTNNKIHNDRLAIFVLSVLSVLSVLFFVLLAAFIIIHVTSGQINTIIYILSVLIKDCTIIIRKTHKCFEDECCTFNRKTTKLTN